MQLSETFGLAENVVEKSIMLDKVAVGKFFEPSGPSSLLYVYDIPYDKGVPSGNKATLHRLGQVGQDTADLPTCWV
jgi:hypothetical protein